MNVNNNDSKRIDDAFSGHRHVATNDEAGNLHKIQAGNIDTHHLKITDHESILSQIETGSGFAKPKIPVPQQSINLQSTSLALEELTDNLSISDLEKKMQNNIPAMTELAMPEDGMSGVYANGMTFNGDYSSNKIAMQMGSYNVELGQTENGENTALVNGQPFNDDLNEVGVLADFFQLMELFHELGISQRQMSREARNTLNESIVKNIKQQAEEKRSDAAYQLTAGVLGGAMKVATSCITLAGSVKALKTDQKALAEGHNPNTLQGNQIMQKYQAVANASEGASEVAVSGIRAQGSQHQAAEVELRADDEHLRHLKQGSQDMIQSAQELLSKIRDIISQLTSQFIQTTSNIIRNS